MELTSTINGNRITKARATLPDWGLWYVDVTTDKPVALSGVVEVQLADLKLSGAIISGGPYRDRASFSVVAGSAGWGKALPKKYYSNDAGVKISKVIEDAARAVGEKVELSTTERVGTSFTRPAGPACRVLELLAPSAWYVGEDGVLRLGRRARTAPTEKITTQNVDLANGVVSIASDKIASLVPGVKVEGLEALDVLHEISAKAIRTVLWGKQGATGSRRLNAFRAIVDQLDPGRKFRGLHEYRVVTQENDRLDLQAVRVSSGMPDLQRVPIRPGVPGCEADFVPGSRVVVGFLDSGPAGAFVLAGDEVGSEGFKPLNLKIDAQLLVKLGAGIKPVGVMGDPGNPAIVASQIKVLA